MLKINAYSICFLLICSFAISSIQTYTFLAPANEDKENPGNCVNPTTGPSFLPPGTHVNEQCEQIICFDDFSSEVLGCGTYSINDPSCKKFERDYTKPYPDCCSAFICTEGKFSHDN